MVLELTAIVTGFLSGDGNRGAGALREELGGWASAISFRGNDPRFTVTTVKGKGLEKELP